MINTIRSLNLLAAKITRLELSWIKAHNNYKGNERADELARNAVYENIIFFGIDPPQSFFKKQLWKAIYKEGNDRWTKDNTCRMTKIFFPHVQKGKSKQLLKMSRKKSRRIIEIVTGQNNLHYIQNKVNKTDLLCRFCEEEEETFNHLITTCPCFHKEQMQVMGIKNWEGTHAWSFDEIYGFSKIKGINKALLGEDSDEGSD